MRFPGFSITAVAIAMILLLSGSNHAASAQQTSPPATADSIYVINLHGSVGAVPGATGIRPITASFLKAELQRAKAAKATAVVLDIDGPGGLVSEMEMMVEEILKAQVNDKMRVVAFVGNAYSAWSIVALACKEIVVQPLSRMGAAVSIRQTVNGFIEAPEGQSALDQKLAAPWHTTQRQVLDLTQRCGCIEDAMTQQTKELWWSPTKGFAATRGPESDWKCLDDAIAVCCLSGAEMLKTGIATAESKDVAGLPAALKIPGAKLTVAAGSSGALVANSGKNSPPPSASRNAAKKVRTALSHLRQVKLNRIVTTRTRTEQFSNPSVVGGQGSRETQVEALETEFERSGRIEAALRKIRGELPSDKECSADPGMQSDVVEIRSLLLEGSDHARSQAWEAIEDRVQAATWLMKSIADRY